MLLMSWDPGQRRVLVTEMGPRSPEHHPQLQANWSLGLQYRLNKAQQRLFTECREWIPAVLIKNPIALRTLCPIEHCGLGLVAYGELSDHTAAGSPLDLQTRQSQALNLYLIRTSKPREGLSTLQLCQGDGKRGRLFYDFVGILAKENKRMPILSHLVTPWKNAQRYCKEWYQGKDTWDNWLSGVKNTQNMFYILKNDLTTVYVFKPQAYTIKSYL